jgi:SAM-dependent methyltransferase
MLDQKAGELTRNMPNNKEIQLNAIRKLEKLIIGFKKERYSSHWASYHRTNSYGDASEKAKMKYVGGIFKRINIQRVLDIGCNTGVYSKIAAANGADVVAIDSDHDCIDVLYKDVRNSGAHILPLCVDISSPSPSIGWLNKERKSFLERADFDCVLSLALIHHLLISGRHPLPQIVDLMSDLTQKYLITEYIGDNDSMFKQLMLNRKETYEFYDLEYFKKEHLVKFNILDELALPEMDRRLFLMEKKEQ